MLRAAVRWFSLVVVVGCCGLQMFAAVERGWPAFAVVCC